jgi:hypothetical protein
MSTDKTTPGPWRVEVDAKGDVAVVADDYGVVAYAQDDNYEANSQLLAAAPELRDALFWFVRKVKLEAREPLIEVREAEALLARLGVTL